MKIAFKNWPEFHHRINLFYHSIIAISLIPFAVVFLGLDSGKTTEAILTNSISWVAIAILIPVIVFSFYQVWNKTNQKLASIISFPLKERLENYFSYQLKRYLWLEFGALISLLGLWLMLNYFFALVYLVALVQFSLLRPSQDKVIRDLQLTKEERDHLRSDDL